jgi:hypothetical protein
LGANALLPAATRDKYFVPGRGNRYGWFIRQRFGHRVMSSNGRSPGFTAELDYFPDDDVTIILLSNSYASVSQDPVAEGIAAIVFEQKVSSPPDMAGAMIAQSTLASYAGEYQYGPEYFVPNAQFTLIDEPGCLLLQLGTFRTPLVPLSEVEFLERNYFGHVVISKDADGKVDGLIYRLAGKEFTAHRLAGK